MRRRCDSYRMILSMVSFEGSNRVLTSLSILSIVMLSSRGTPSFSPYSAAMARSSGMSSRKWAVISVS